MPWFGRPVGAANKSGDDTAATLRPFTYPRGPAAMIRASRMSAAPRR